MNTCTKVFLRKKAISCGRISLYLDFYPAIRYPHTNRMSRRETLGIYIYASPKNEREKQFNASMRKRQKLSVVAASSNFSTSSLTFSIRTVLC